ncbi:twin-arginine translocase TatA/TatE family subunit [Mycobacterium uberis]|uniref:Sec-independent protein translocase protein TatA n=1 Tax=Mycobacterium uberis TaxID=2162698 RepID=A0A3E1HCH2_9MYCO|nr:Sec-independent protein translocase subunit TatA [Mycobacterium uberis]RFD24143.1 twin-arginine translocase TatA/TatE family subunit [Mycobacterium uberis]
MGSLSPWHWAILAVVVVLLFGAKRLPDAARSLGKSMRIFKSELREMQTENEVEVSALETPIPTPTPAGQSAVVDRSGVPKGVADLARQHRPGP